jgi:hypothetical protein
VSDDERDRVDGDQDAEYERFAPFETAEEKREIQKRERNRGPEGDESQRDGEELDRFPEGCRRRLDRLSDAGDSIAVGIEGAVGVRHLRADTSIRDTTVGTI